MNTRILLATVVFTSIGLVPTQSRAAEIIAEGFDVERLSALPSAEPPRLEAIRHDSYGRGVLAGVMNGGLLEIRRYPSSESSLFASVGPFNDKAELVAMRFDTAGQFGDRLIVSVAHDAADRPGRNVVTDLYAIGPDGVPELLKSFGDATNPVTLTFAISDRERGYAPGMYLQDRDLRGGSAMYHMDPSLRVSLLGKNFVPKGRHDLDIQEMEFDPTGLYSGYLYLADADDHDKLSGVYLLDDEFQWTERTEFDTLGSVAYADLEFSAGGALGLNLYVIERVRNRVVTISPTGEVSDFAKGFRKIRSLTVSDNGSEMYAADQDGIYRIHATR